MTFNKKAWRLKNKEYLKQKRKEWRLKNKEHLKEYKKEYYSKNLEHINAYLKEYYLKNKVRVHQVQNKYIKKRRRTDPNFRLKLNLRTRIVHALKGKNKSASTLELIGCTIEELWVHLESSPKWELWMTRENYGRSGGWDVDHIKACANFNLTDPEQQRICCNWSNLQPMDHIANIKKGAR